MLSSSYTAATISGQVALARISSEPITAETCLAAVGHPAAGGIGCFVGVVRNDDHGRSVSSLEYEVHPSAATRFQAVCSRAAEADVIAVAAEHRVGILAIGEVAVVVAVSATHRGEALRATQGLIDAIKSEVPIWKHQHFTDGTDEWVGC